MAKFVILFSLIAFSGFVTAAPNWFSPAAAGKCNVDDCQLPDCRCFGVTPSLEKDQLPQVSKPIKFLKKTELQPEKVRKRHRPKPVVL